MATPSGWNWISEYWKLYEAYGTVWRQLQERLDWYDNLSRYNDKLVRQNARLTEANNRLTAVNRRLIEENTALREGASETRGQVEAEVVDKLNTSLEKAKAA